MIPNANLIFDHRVFFQRAPGGLRMPRKRLFIHKSTNWQRPYRQKYLEGPETRPGGHNLSSKSPKSVSEPTETLARNPAEIRISDNFEIRNFDLLCGERLANNSVCRDARNILFIDKSSLKTCFLDRLMPAEKKHGGQR